jgi:hypothetical protein
MLASIPSQRKIGKAAATTANLFAAAKRLDAA